jgi:hypothetical protein
MKLKKLLNEELPLIKFNYKNYKKDKSPKVQVLDFNYPGIKGQKTYGQREDILGFNTNYYKEKRFGKEAIDDIDTFARLIKADNKEKYQRIKDFYPDALPYIRRYQKKHIKKLKLKKGRLWEPVDWSDCEDYNKDLI